MDIIDHRLHFVENLMVGTVMMCSNLITYFQNVFFQTNYKSKSVF